MNWCRANLRCNISNDYGLRNCQPNYAHVLVPLASVLKLLIFRWNDCLVGKNLRLHMAIAAIEASHILTLDEPTNLLDIESREALVHALDRYEGCVVFISHDAHLVELVVDCLWLMEHGHTCVFNGDMADYKNGCWQNPAAPDRQMPVNQQQSQLINDYLPAVSTGKTPVQYVLKYEAVKQDQKPLVRKNKPSKEKWLYRDFIILSMRTILPRLVLNSPA